MVTPTTGGSPIDPTNDIKVPSSSKIKDGAGKENVTDKVKLLVSDSDKESPKLHTENSQTQTHNKSYNATLQKGSSKELPVVIHALHKEVKTGDPDETLSRELLEAYGPKEKKTISSFDSEADLNYTLRSPFKEAQEAANKIIGTINFEKFDSEDPISSFTLKIIVNDLKTYGEKEKNWKNEDNDKIKQAIKDYEVFEKNEILGAYAKVARALLVKILFYQGIDN